eukprot:Opistho-1_new@74946
MSSRALRSPSLGDVPVEVLLAHIASRLNQRSLVSLSSVSRAFRRTLAPLLTCVLRNWRAYEYITDPALREELTEAGLGVRIVWSAIECRFHVEDWAVFARVHELDVHHYDDVIDVSSLGRLRRLELRGCANITGDISALGRVRRLALENCAHLRDVSSLGNVHTLDLRGCAGVRTCPCSVTFILST